MGEIVWAAATVHAPQLLTRPPQEDQAQLQAGIDAMGELGKGLDETKPDALIVIGIDHVETFFPDTTPAFAIITGERATAEFAGREWDIPIHTQAAEAILNAMVEGGVDLTYAHEAHLGHAFATPFEYVHQGRDIPVVPMFVNVYLPPLPTSRRCYEVGEILGKALEGIPGRFAVLASGGMSHYPGTYKYFTPEYEFDRWMIQEIEEGRTESLLDLTGVELDETGNTELLPWSIMLGATKAPRGELLTYQPTSHHGHAVLRFIPDTGGRGQEHRDMPKYGGFEFKLTSPHFYTYPGVDTFPFNKALHGLRMNRALRDRFVRDIDGVGAELGMTAEQIEAMKKYSVDAIVAVGAHGIMAITVMLVLQRSAKEAGIEITSVA